MCIDYTDVLEWATPEEQELLDQYEDASDWDSWDKVYEKIEEEMFDRRKAYRLAQIRARQERDLRKKEIELFRAAESLGLHLSEPVKIPTAV